MATNLSIKQPGIHSSQAEHVESKTVIPLPASKTGTVKRKEHVCFVHPAHELVINCNRLCAINIDFISFLSVKPFAGIDWLFTCKVGNASTLLLSNQAVTITVSVVSTTSCAQPRPFFPISFSDKIGQFRDLFMFSVATVQISSGEEK